MLAMHLFEIVFDRVALRLQISTLHYCACICCLKYICFLKCVRAILLMIVVTKEIDAKSMSILAELLSMQFLCCIMLCRFLAKILAPEGSKDVLVGQPIAITV